MSARKTPTKQAQPLSKKSSKKTQTPPRWSNAQKLTLSLAVLSLIGLVASPVLPAVFSNWDKLSSAAKPEFNPMNIRTMLLENRKQECFARIKTTEESVDEAVTAVRDSSAPASEQVAAGRAADELKALLKTHLARIENAYQRLEEAIKSGNTIECDVRQKELHKELLELQRNFDKKLPETPLKNFMDLPHVDYIQAAKPLG